MTNFIRSFFATRQRSYLIPIGIICFIGLSYLACRKSAASSNLSDQALIQSYRTYFEANVQPFHNPDTSVSSAEIRMTLHKTPNWARAVVKQFNFGRAVVVPIAFKEKIYLQSSLGEISLDSTSAMLLYADDKGAMHSEVVTKMPDRNFLFGLSKTFTGIAAVEDWSGHPLVAYNYAQSGTSVVASRITGGSATSSGPGSGVQVQDETDAFCTVYNYYLCAGDVSNTDDCVFEYSYGDAGCSAGGGSGGTGGENNQSTALKVIYDYNTTPTGDLLTPAQYRAIAEQFTFPVSPSPITDIPGYIHCFDGTGTAYSVALLVQQPAPGSEAEYTMNAPGAVPLYNVGHTFLAFYETLANGTQIVRYMGTYPATTAAAWPLGQHPVVLGNDQGQPYNAGLTVQVSASQFTAILSYMTNITGMYYNLYTNNCTNMAMNALAAGGFTLTPYEGSYPSFPAGFTTVENSGFLGYYILNTTFSSNMTVTNASMTAGANAGTCN